MEYTWPSHSDNSAPTRASTCVTFGLELCSHFMIGWLLQLHIMQVESSCKAGKSAFGCLNVTPIRFNGDHAFIRTAFSCIATHLITFCFLVLRVLLGTWDMLTLIGAGALILACDTHGRVILHSYHRAAYIESVLFWLMSLAPWDVLHFDAMQYCCLRVL